MAPTDAGRRRSGSRCIAGLCVIIGVVILPAGGCCGQVKERLCELCLKCSDINRLLTDVTGICKGGYQIVDCEGHGSD